MNKISLHLCVIAASVLGPADQARAGAPLPSTITILSHTLETETEAIGGGGATPFNLGPVVLNGNDLFLNDIDNVLQTGVQPARDAAQNDRGSGSGTGIAVGDSEVDIDDSRIQGVLYSEAGYTATPDLGSGLGQSDATLRIVFRPQEDTGYLLNASLTPLVGSLGGGDVFSIRRTSQIGNPFVHLINNAIPAPIVGATGTFLAGEEYTIFADLSNAEAGGSANSPGASQTRVDFTIEFDIGTIIAIGGDLNNDGFVGIDDLNLVLSNWNQTVPPGNPLADPNGDGFVGIDDLNEVLSNWNQAFPEVPSSVVPEPATACLLLIGAAFGTLYRSTRRN